MFIKIGSGFLDVDECASDIDNCDTNAVCTNTHGSFTCSCRSGYVENGETCIGKIGCLCMMSECFWNKFESVIQISTSVPLVLTIVMPMLCVLTLLGASRVHVSLVIVEME